MTRTLERTAEAALDRWGRQSGGNGWPERHAEAINGHPARAPIGEDIEWGESERAFLAMFRAWEKYAETHTLRHAAPIGDDGYTGPEWASIGQALHRMLSCDHGPRLDGGTLSGAIIEVWKRHGFNDEGERE
jgi:hypothetical protein